MNKNNDINKVKEVTTPPPFTGGGQGGGSVGPGRGSAAVFVGSFDPFTIGHADIVSRALVQFDKVIIGMGINEKKTYMFDRAEELKRIRQYYAGNPRVEVRSFSDFTIDFAKLCHATAIVKGVRSVKDFEYEREQADINLAIGNVDTVLFFCRPELASVSSSLVRTFKTFGKDYSMFLPKEPKQPNN